MPRLLRQAPHFRAPRGYALSSLLHERPRSHLIYRTLIMDIVSVGSEAHAQVAGGRSLMVENRQAGGQSGQGGRRDSANQNAASAAAALDPMALLLEQKK